MVGEPGTFFESSSELATSFAWRNGKPRLNRRAADDVLLLVLGPDAFVVLDALFSRAESFDDRFPYLFFKYRAHELSAAPSLSSVDDWAVIAERKGDGSRDFKA